MICLGVTTLTSTSQSSYPLICTSTIQCTSTSLEQSLRKYIESEEAIQIFESDDAVLLHCRSSANEDSILGFSGTDSSIHVTKLEPDVNSVSDDCRCSHSRREWYRNQIEPNETTSISSIERELTIIDLTKLQLHRTHRYPSFDTPGQVFHLLRSILTCPSGLHCASPWYNGTSSCHGDRAVALLLTKPLSGQNNQNELEERELNELIHFRTGDAAPSYYLHSTVSLRVVPIESNHTSDDMRLAGLFQNNDVSDTVLLVFRHLPPRDVLTIEEPKHLGFKYNLQLNEKEHLGCLWERYGESHSEIESDDQCQQNQKIIKYRIISPPYLSYEQEYPGLLDSLLNNINQIQEEAKQIPQWTAWPEKNHYSSSSDDENNPYAAWTVFPLCHTFPASDVSRRKFIKTTCSFVPITTSLLKGIGPKLRTALFSRLDKETTLGTHTGWSDLANHVLRVHIPLVVPSGDSCGTWVDGCVETHHERRVLVFDDSRNHRAFCYGNDERIVLILDLERPESLPIGTATGGHTDELDEFINQWT